MTHVRKDTQVCITINTAEARDWGKLTKTLQKLNPGWVLLLNGNESARIRQILPNVNIIQREGPPDGGNRFTPGNDGYQDVQTYYNRVTAIYPADTYILVCNEVPGITDNSMTAAPFNKFMLALGALAVAGKRRFAFGTVPTASVRNPGDWAKINPVLEMVAANRDLFVFTITEYAPGVMTAGVNSKTPDQYPLDPATWPKEWDTNMRNWTAGRWLDLWKNLVMDPLIHDMPRVVSIETGLDQTDVRDWLNTLPKRPAEGDSNLTEISRGWRTLRETWLTWIPKFSVPYNKLTWVGYFAQQMMWYRDVLYTPYRNLDGDSIVEAIMPFMWNTNHEWTAFDMSHPEADEFWDDISTDQANPTPKPWTKALSTEIPPTLPGPVSQPPPAVLPVAAVLRTDGSNIYLRQSADPKAFILTKVADGELIGWYPDSGVINAGYSWYRVDYKGFSGWMALLSENAGDQFGPLKSTSYRTFHIAVEFDRAISKETQDAVAKAYQETLDKLGETLVSASAGLIIPTVIGD